MNSRVLCWFSCGSASAVAAKLSIEQHAGRCEVLYCDTLAYEHPDNRRFLRDVERWLGVPIKILKSDTYTDIFDVFERTRWLVGAGGARCTTELKKNVRTAYQQPDDVHVFGFTADEGHRVKRFYEQHPDLFAEFPLADQRVTKAECHRRIADAGIQAPAMYRLGYANNNCIGCVKGGVGYWNRIRIDFPDAFARMAAMERHLGVAICKVTIHGKRVHTFLDKLPPNLQQTFELESDMECGVLCQ